MENDNINQKATGQTENDEVVADEVEGADTPSNTEADEKKPDEKKSDEKTESEVNETSEDVKKKKFGKEKKSKEVAALEQKVEELNDRVMRNMAEFDNFRKRSEKEKAQMFDIGAKSIIEKVLPVIDNFERGLGTITEEEKESAFAQGIEKIYKQFTTALAEAGVKTIDAVGTAFDPNLHNAVMHGEDESLGENIVSEEFQKGYTYHDSVVRHSMVKVVN